MCESGKLNCRMIATFPKPFSLEKTPYTQSDFSDSVKTTSSSINSLMNGLRMCKVIILGDVNVGKTSIVNRFCRQIFNFNYKGTIGVDFEIEQFNILGIPFNMQMIKEAPFLRSLNKLLYSWDTAGQERFRCIAAAYYRSAHVIVTVFDLSNIKSLYHCTVWMKEALDSNIEAPLKFLVGTKKDLLMDSVYNEVEKEAAKVATIMDAEYWAVSSRTGKGVTEVFNRIAALSLEQIIKSEFENPEKQHRLKLGQSIIRKFEEKTEREESFQIF